VICTKTAFDAGLWYFCVKVFSGPFYKRDCLIVDIPEGTVKSLLSNGLKELRKLMKDGVRGDENL